VEAPVATQQPRDYRDWLVMTLVTVAWGVATVFLFQHATEMNFATWAAFSGTTTGVYHWLCVKDQKMPDAYQGGT